MAQGSAGARAAVVGGLRLFPLRIVQYASLFVAGLIVAKALGPEGRAAYALPTTLASSIFVVIHLTVSDAAGRLMARHTAPIEQIVRTLCTLSVALSAAGCVLFLVVARLLQGTVVTNSFGTIALLSLATIPPAVVVQTAGGILLRTDRLATFVRVSVAGAIAQAATVGVLEATAGLTPALAAVGLLASGGVTAVGLTIAVGRTLGARALAPVIDMAVIRPLVRAALALHPGTLALFLTMRVDLLIMAGLTGHRQIGLYSLAITLGELVLFAAVALSQAATHHQTHQAEAEAASFTAAFVRQSWPIIAGLTLVLTVAAWPGVHLVYGAEWDASVPALIILCWAVAALAITGPLPIFLTRSVERLKLAGAAGIALAVNVTLVILLVPPLGATGAALASLAGYWLYAERLFALMRRHHGIGVREMLARPRPGDPVLSILGRVRG